MVETADPVRQEQKPLQGERVAFTGTLASMTHRHAAQLAEEHGGVAAHNVSKQLTMLVIGEEGWPLEADGSPSAKLQQAQRLRDEGFAIRIVSESDWLQILGLQDPRIAVRRHYTPAMLSQILNVSVSAIRSWERTGLIRPVKHVLRLAYFDFREVSTARRLHDLLKSGVTRRQIAESLKHLRSWLTGTERPLDQLEFLADDGELIYRDRTGPLDPRSGQRLFDFEGPDSDANSESKSVLNSDIQASASFPGQVSWTAEQWLDAAHEHLEQGLLEDAVEAFRLCLLDWAQRADVHFQLAETLYRMNNLAGALERYHMAVELDPQYLEAWTQLGCVYSETAKPDSAIHAFQIALDLHPDYPDAHWHLAQTLKLQGQSEAAKPHWKAYLLFDQRGPWADIARENLDELPQT